MNKKKKIIGVDFDDVLMDTNTALSVFHNSVYGTSYTRDQVVSYELENIWGCTSEEAIRRVHEFYYSSTHIELTPTKGAVEAIKKLAEFNNLIVITARPDEIRNLTHGLLEQYFPGMFQDVYFTNHYHKDINKRKTKADICKELNIDIFIDDSLFHAANVAALGVSTFLFSAPWNQGVFPEPDPIIRVNSWEDVLNKIEENR